MTDKNHKGSAAGNAARDGYKKTKLGWIPVEWNATTSNRKNKSKAMRKAINRSVLVVIPRQPYYDWGAEVFGDHPYEPFEECVAYLLDDDWTVNDVKRFLKANFDDIFKDLLEGMCTYPEAWPEKRSWKKFNEWFDWHYSSMAWDLLPGKRIRREAF